MIHSIETLRTPSLRDIDTKTKHNLVVTVSALPIIPEGYCDSPDGTELAWYRMMLKYSKFPLICSILLDISLKNGFIRPERIGGVGNSWTAEAIAETWHLPYISAGNAVKKLQEKMKYPKTPEATKKFYHLLDTHSQYDIEIERIILEFIKENRSVVLDTKIWQRIVRQALSKPNTGHPPITPNDLDLFANMLHIVTDVPPLIAADRLMKRDNLPSLGDAEIIQSIRWKSDFLRMLRKGILLTRDAFLTSANYKLSTQVSPSQQIESLHNALSLTFGSSFIEMLTQDSRSQ